MLLSWNYLVTVKTRWSLYVDIACFSTIQVYKPLQAMVTDLRTRADPLEKHVSNSSLKSIVFSHCKAV